MNKEIKFDILIKKVLVYIYFFDVVGVVFIVKSKVFIIN